MDSTIYFDGIKAVELAKENLDMIDGNGLIITDDSLVGDAFDEPIEPTEPIKPEEGNSKEEETKEQVENMIMKMVRCPFKHKDYRYPKDRRKCGFSSNYFLVCYNDNFISYRQGTCCD